MIYDTPVQKHNLNSRSVIIELFMLGLTLTTILKQKGGENK